MATNACRGRWTAAPLGAALLACLSAAPAAADAVSGCLVPAGDLSETVGFLGAEGWTRVDALGDPAAEALIWTYVAAYLGTDMGGASLPEIVALQRRTVAGLGRKVDSPASQTELMTRGTGAATEAMVATRVVGTDDLVEITCRFAFTDPAAALPEGEGAGRDGAGEPQMSYTREDGVGRSTLAIALDPRYLSRALDADVSVTHVVETTLSFPASQLSEGASR